MLLVEINMKINNYLKKTINTQINKLFNKNSVNKKTTKNNIKTNHHINNIKINLINLHPQNPQPTLVHNI